MVIVLGIMGLLIGTAVTKFVLSSSERLLRTSQTDIEILSQKSRMLAIVQQTPYAITVYEDRLMLGPLAEAGYTPEELQERLEYERDQQDSGVTKPKFSPVRETLDLSKFSVSVMRWGAVDWVTMRNNDPQVWRFDSNGICEPISLKLEYEKGYLMMGFHPLSATVRELEMEAYR